MSTSSYPSPGVSDGQTAPHAVIESPAAPAGPDWIGMLAADLGEKLGPALDGFVGKPLARFGSKSRAASGSAGYVNVALQKVNRSTRSGAAQLVLDFKCEPASGAALTLPVMLNPIRRTEQGRLVYPIQIGGSYGSWECAVLENGALTVQTAFSRPTGLSALEHLYTVWCGSQVESAKAGVAAGVERLGNVIINDAVAGFWTGGQLGSKKRECGLARAPGVDVDEKMSTKAADRAASILVFCLWGILLRTLSEPDSDETIPFDALVAPEARGFPAADAYWPRRSVDLIARQVQAALQEQGLVIPWHVIEAACAALNLDGITCARSRSCSGAARSTCGWQPLILRYTKPRPKLSPIAANIARNRLTNATTTFMHTLRGTTPRQ